MPNYRLRKSLTLFLGRLASRRLQIKSSWLCFQGSDGCVSLWLIGALWFRDKDQYLAKLNDSRFALFLSDKRIQGEIKSNYLATLAVSTQVHSLDELIARVSVWLKLVHIVAYVKRFIQRRPSSDKASRTLTFGEVRAARIFCRRHVQRWVQVHYELLLAKKPLRNRSQVVKLVPMIGEIDLLRVGRRLHQSYLSREAKNILLLSKRITSRSWSWNTSIK